jgi:hypothetical protein
MPRKEFEAFTRLDASDVNTYLMDQSVMSFAGTAARGSAIPSPVLGMYTHLEDTPARLEFWNGSAWVSPFGLTLLSVGTPAATSSVSFNNVFSSSYQNYVIYSNVSGTDAATLNLRLRVGGANATTGYVNQSLAGDGSTPTSGRDSVSQNFAIGVTRSSGVSFGRAELSNPFAASPTSYLSHSQDPLSGGRVVLNSGSNSNSTSYDGFTVYPDSGTITGTIRVYGVRN